MRLKMKNIGRGLCLLALVTTTQLRAAEKWVQYQSSGPMNTFIDMGSVRVIDGVTSYRVLINTESNSFSKVGSTVLSNEINCGKKLARFVSSTSFSHSYGQGAVLSRMNAAQLGGNIGKFAPIENELADQHRVVCSK